jgi:hypothetical protein
MKEILSEEDFIEAARELNCEAAIVKAVSEVESSGSGFLENGNPKILFEANIFSQETKHIYDNSHPDISSKKWNKALYKGGLAEYERLEKAKLLNFTAALHSASWGKFQIMGFNYALCGYQSVQLFVEDMYVSEKEHLACFLKFVKALKLDACLVNKDWAKFSAGYNGKGYKLNNYDVKLQKAYNKFSITG